MNASIERRIPVQGDERHAGARQALLQAERAAQFPRAVDEICDAQSHAVKRGRVGRPLILDHFVAKQIPPQQWAHMVVTMTVPSGSGAGSATLSVNGTQLLSTSISVTVTNWTPSLIMGITYVAPPANAWGIHYDNITFDSK